MEKCRFCFNLDDPRTHDCQVINNMQKQALEDGQKNMTKKAAKEPKKINATPAASDPGPSGKQRRKTDATPAHTCGFCDGKFNSDEELLKHLPNCPIHKELAVLRELQRKISKNDK